MRERVQKAIDDIIKPNLRDNGGDVELVDITDDGVVSVRMLGACSGCPMRQTTLKMGIEKHLKSVVPEVKEVVEV